MRGILMSRIAKNPIKITKDVECSFNEGIFSAKGKLGKIEIAVNSNFNINIKEDSIFRLADTLLRFKLEELLRRQACPVWWSLYLGFFAL